MKKISLVAKTRKEIRKKLNLLRQENKIPAILYGHNIKPRPLFVDNSVFSRVFKFAGESSIIELLIDDEEKKNVLIKNIQKDPRTDKFLHIDFYQVKLTEKIKAKVPLVFFGEALAVKEKGGVLVKNIDEIEIEALPHDLPKEIRVDISSLKDFSDVIRIRDLDISAAVEVLTKREEIIATTTPPRSEEELEKLEEKVEERVEEIEGVKKEESAEVKSEVTKTEAAAASRKKEEKKEK